MATICWRDQIKINMSRADAAASMDGWMDEMEMLLLTVQFKIQLGTDMMIMFLKLY